MFDALNPAEFRALSLDACPRRVTERVAQAQGTADTAGQSPLESDSQVKTVFPAEEGMLSEAERKAASPATWQCMWPGGND